MNAGKIPSSCTLALIAKLAGVSKATVSRVLNNTGAASTETRERVLSIAREHNYVPDAGFRHLSGLKRTGKAARTGSIGLLLFARKESEYAAHPYYGRLFWAIEHAVASRGLHLVVSSTDGGEGLAKVVAERKVDGVVVVDSMPPECVERIAGMLPVVLVNNMFEGSCIPSVMADEAVGVRKAVEHLRSLGHVKITFFDIADSERPNMNHVLRGRAFREQMLDAGDAAARWKVVVLPSRCKSLARTLYDQLASWKAAGDMPTALLCAADTYALAFMEAAARLGIAVPEELSIVGADDTLPCRYVRPGLTSIQQPFEVMGAAGVGHLLQMIESGEGSRTPLTMLFGEELILRQSCAQAKS